MWLKTLNRCDIRLKALSASISGSAPDKSAKARLNCECSKYTGDRPHQTVKINVSASWRQCLICKLQVLEQSWVTDQMIRGGRGNGAFAQWWTWTNLSDYQLAPVAFIVYTL